MRLCTASVQDTSGIKRGQKMTRNKFESGAQVLREAARQCERGAWSGNLYEITHSFSDAHTEACAALREVIDFSDNWSELSVDERVIALGLAAAIKPL